MRLYSVFKEITLVLTLSISFLCPRTLFAEIHEVNSPLPQGSSSHRISKPNAKYCFICQYLDEPCITNLTKDTCEKYYTYKDDEFKIQNCKWHNGGCLSNFLIGCNDWINKKQKEMNRDNPEAKFNYTLTPIPKERGKGSKPLRDANLDRCDYLYYHYDGHGRLLDDTIERLTQLSSQSRGQYPLQLDYSDVGCSTFTDLSEEREKLITISKLLKPNEQIIVHANQQISSASSPTTYNFKITPAGVEDLPAEMCIDGQGCYRENERAFCWKGNGYTRQVCCKVGEQLLWTVGKLSCAG